MPKRKSIECVIDTFAKRDLTLNSLNYINNKTPLDCVDKEGYKYRISLKCVEDGRVWKNSKFATYNPYTIENIKNYITINNLSCKLISTEFKSVNKHKLEFECKCGKRYFLVLQHFLNLNKQHCNNCSTKNRVEKIKNSIYDIENIIAKTKYTLVDNVVQSSKHIHIKDEYGYKYNTTIYNLKNREDKYIKFNIRNPYQLENIKLYMKLNKIKCEMLTDNPIDDTKKTLVEFRCCTCGKIFKSILSDVLYFNRNRCIRCTKIQSNISVLVEDYLIENKINYIKEYRFNDCRNIKPLPFDFYLTKYNTCIEVQGSQHYYQNQLFSQSLEDRIRIDKIKEKYCQDNNIGYLAIPYWNIYNNGEKKIYKELIDNIINQN